LRFLSGDLVELGPTVLIDEEPKGGDIFESGLLVVMRHAAKGVIRE